MRTCVLQAGSGPDLILLHGNGGHLEWYARTIAGMAADFRVTVYDMVGHGWSDMPDHPYTIDVLCDHLIGLMDPLGIGRAHLSGASLGGWVVALTAAFHRSGSTGWCSTRPATSPTNPRRWPGCVTASCRQC